MVISLQRRHHDDPSGICADRLLMRAFARSTSFKLNTRGANAVRNSTARKRMRRTVRAFRDRGRTRRGPFEWTVRPEKPPDFWEARLQRGVLDLHAAPGASADPDRRCGRFRGWPSVSETQRDVAENNQLLRSSVTSATATSITRCWWTCRTPTRSRWPGFNERLIERALYGWNLHRRAWGRAG